MAFLSVSVFDSSAARQMEQGNPYQALPLKLRQATPLSGGRTGLANDAHTDSTLVRASRAKQSQACAAIGSWGSRVLGPGSSGRQAEVMSHLLSGKPSRGPYPAKGGGRRGVGGPTGHYRGEVADDMECV